MSLTHIILIAAGAFVVLILAGLAIVNTSGEALYDKFKKLSEHPAIASPLEFANYISKTFFKGQIVVEYSEQPLSDSYSSDGKLTLCQDYAGQKQLGGLAIAAHELGHAFQFAKDRPKMKKHGKKLRLSKTLSKFITPLFIGGIVLLCFEYYIFAIACAVLAIILFILACSVKMSTIKIESEASQIGLDLLKTYAFLDDKQLKLRQRRRHQIQEDIFIHGRLHHTGFPRAYAV